MPFLNIQTNVKPDAARKTEILQQASAETARLLGKPESAMCVALQAGTDMSFAGSDAPCAMVTLGSLGLEASQIPPVAKGLTETLANALGVDGQRLYLAFESPPRTHWAKDGTPYA